MTFNGEYRIPAHNMLRAWGHFERDRNQLRDFDIEHARCLFSALARLRPDQLQLLAEKYHTGIKAGFEADTRLKKAGIRGQWRMDKPIPDKQLAERHGIKQWEYQKIRVSAEHDLEILMYGGSAI